MTNIHPYQRAHDAREYMTLDMNSLNPYNYKNFPNRFATYQIYQNDYYNTKQLNPISLVYNGPQWINPNNFPCNIRPGFFEATDLNNVIRTNQYQTPQNNSSLWRENLPAKAGYYTMHDPTYPRQISNILAGQASSFIPYHGMQLY